MTAAENRADIIDFLYSAEISSTQCEIDLRQSESASVIYNLDYSSFFCGIWDKHRRESLYDAVSGEFYNEIVKSKKLPFRPIITSVTFLELMETFLNKVDEQKSRAKSITDRVSKIRGNISLIKDGIEGVKFPFNQVEIQKQLDLLYDLTGKTLRKSIRRAENLLGSGRQVLGLGDVLGPKATQIEFSQQKIDELYGKMWEYRSDKHPSRDTQEKEFRFLVDALNIYVTSELNRVSNEVEYNYVSKASYTSHFCPKQGRTPLVPLFWLKSFNSKEFLSNNERILFFKSLKEQSGFLFGRFLARTDMPPRDSLNYTLLKNFTETYMKQLDVIREYRESHPNLQEDRLFTDPKYIKREMDHNISESEKMFGRLFNDFGGIYTDDLIEKGGIGRLDYFKELITKLEKGRSRHQN